MRIEVSCARCVASVLIVDVMDDGPALESRNTKSQWLNEKDGSICTDCHQRPVGKDAWRDIKPDPDVKPPEIEPLPDPVIVR